MGTPIFKQIANFLHEQKNHKRWLAVFMCMAVVVCFGTVAALKLMGQALTKKEKVLVCSLEVHEHTEVCYDGDRNLVCGYADYVVHTHNDDCYDRENMLVCTLPEVEKHEHTEECYEEEKNLVCGQEETAGHVHAEECYTRQMGELQCPIPEHEHMEECYDEAGMIACGMEEHAHTDECHAWNDVLACQTGEGEGSHTHTEECYDVQKLLSCGKLELHTHTDECYEKINEEEPYGEENRRLICTIPVLEEHVHTQEAGCVEMIEPEDEKEEVSDEQSEEEAENQVEDQTVIMEDSSAEQAEPIYYCGLKEHTHGEECYDEAGERICELEEHVHGEECTAADIELEAETDDYMIILEASKEAFPDVEGELALDVSELEEDSKEYQKSKELVEESTEPEEPDSECPFEITVEEDGKEVPVTLSGEAESIHYIYDIRVLEDGTEIQPEVPVRVSFIPKETALDDLGNEERKTRIFHIDTEGELVEDMDAEEDEDGKTVFDTPHFSTYDITISVNGNDVAWGGGDSYWCTLADYIYSGSGNDSTIRVKLTNDLEVTKSSASDAADDRSVIWVDNNRDLTIDLNGHKIICDQQMNRSRLFVVGNNSYGKLTIMDSASVNRDGIDVEESTPLSADEWYEGSYNPDEKKGIYYLTKSTGSDNEGKTSAYVEDTPASIGTEETTYKHAVDFSNVGAIENKNESISALIEVWGSDADVIIQGGRLTNLHGRAIVAEEQGSSNSSNVSLEGGYLFGNGQMTQPDKGGAVAFYGSGRLDIKGNVVIAANKSSVDGAGIFASGIENAKSLNITMENGFICSNRAEGTNGGGIYVRHADLKLGGGFITNNYAKKGGSGILIYKAVMEMKNGTIASNRSDWAGGGIYAEKVGYVTGVDTLKIQGGVIASNYVNAEGGGIRLDDGYIEIAANENDPHLIYITNNETTSQNGETRDWGGGGIFISQEKGYVSIYDSLITENHAGGFGGGVGGCSTGRLSISDTRGAAIYGNEARGTGLSGGGSTKSEDHDAYADKEVFNSREQNYQDVFSALGCRISQKMLGGIPAYWEGSYDHIKIENKPDYPDEIVSTKLLGLTAYPKEDDIATVRKKARVYISGNKSGTHGGGIMCNGVLILGDKNLLLYDESLTIDFQKILQDEDGNRVPLLGNEFEFVIEDEKGKEIARTSNTAENNGVNVFFVQRYEFFKGFSGSDEDKERMENEVLGQKKYIVKEVAKEDDGITYSEEEYTITIDVKMGEAIEHQMGAKTLNRYWIYIDPKTAKMTAPGAATVENSGWAFGNAEGGTLHKGAHISIKGHDKVIKGENGDYTITQDPENKGYAFINISKKKEVGFKIRKTDDEENILQRVQFYLTEIGEDGKKAEGYTPSILDTFETGVISASLPNENKRYILEEEIPDGYADAGPWMISTDGEGNITVCIAKKEIDGTYTATGISVEDAKVDGIPVFHITNIPMTYELPKTGGKGLILYTMASGICVMLGVALMYKKKVRERRV